MSKPWGRCHSLEDRFLYFIDCQLATVESLAMKARPPVGELRRQKGIAKKMIKTARECHIEGVEQMSRVIDFENDLEF